MNKYIIGLGNRARNGKDSTAEYLASKNNNSHIVHWADALYEECQNPLRIHPLIKKMTGINTSGDTAEFYYLLDDFTDSPRYRYCVRTIYEVPKIHEFMKDKGNEYWGMDEKEPILLQGWGTDHRRNSDPNYWVNITVNRINTIVDDNNNGDIFIYVPDTRFENEVDALLNDLGGIWIQVERYHENGDRYYAEDRDPNHPSEASLENYIQLGKYDYVIKAKSEDLESIHKQADDIYSKITNMESVAI